MIGHENISNDNNENALGMEAHFNNLKGQNNKLRFLMGAVNLQLNAPEMLSDEENSTIVSISSNMPLSVSVNKNGNKSYNLKTSESVVKNFVHWKYQNILNLGSYYRNVRQTLPKNTSEKEAVAGHIALSSEPSIHVEIFNNIENNMKNIDEAVSTDIFKQSGKTWLELYNTYSEQSYQDFYDSLNAAQKEDFKAGLDLASKNPKIINNKSAKELGISGLESTKSDSVKSIIDNYSNLSYRENDITIALDKFNTKRSKAFGGWWDADPKAGKETMEHWNLRFATQELIKAKERFDKYNNSPDVSTADKQYAAYDLYMKASNAVVISYNYITAYKKQPRTPAGKLRREGASEINQLGVSICNDMYKYMNNDLIKANPYIKQARTYNNTMTSIKINMPQNATSINVSTPQSNTTVNVSTSNNYRQVKTVNNNVAVQQAPANRQTISQNAQPNAPQKYTNLKIDKQNNFEFHDPSMDIKKERYILSKSDKGFSLSEVAVNPKMRSTMLGYAEKCSKLSRDILNIGTGDKMSDFENVTKCIQKLEYMSGKENLKEFNDMLIDLDNASNSYSGKDPEKLKIIASTKTFLTEAQSQITKDFNNKRNNIIDTDKKLNNVKKEYENILTEIKTLKDSGVGSKELDELEKSINKFTSSIDNKKIYKYDKVKTMLNDISNKTTACFDENEKISALAEKCSNQNSKTFRSITSIKRFEKEEQKQQGIVNNMLKSIKAPKDMSLKEISSFTKSQLDKSRKDEVTDDEFENMLKDGSKKLQETKKQVRQLRTGRREQPNMKRNSNPATSKENNLVL
ncbi:MAG: hypothetical protein K6A23_10340 [Butyrivibrio sp.]|nr:hypothetical protein [Butyrivibrio sp.]